MESQLHDVMQAVIGEPPHQVSAEAVRRRVRRRRVMDAVGVTAAAAVLAGAGLGVAAGAGVFGTGPRPAAPVVAGEPRYYVQGLIGQTVQPPVVRATATGTVTATIRCPWPGAQVAQQGIAAAGIQTFFMVCEKRARRNTNSVITGSRIYRFQLTGSGRVSGYSLLRGGVLGPHSLAGLAAAPDGAQLAVGEGPAAVGVPSSAPEDVLVINTRTGARAVWRGGTEVRSAADLAFTHDGRDLEFIGLKQCAQGLSGPACEQLRAVSHPAAGGQLDRSRVILPLSALALSAADNLEDVLIEPGGSTLIAAVVDIPNRPQSSRSILVNEYSTTGKQLRVLYRMRTGDGFFYRFVSSDPTGRFLLFNAGPASGTVNGWIDHGWLVELKPANGSNVFYETW